ncbi:MAG TPA: ThiF family adenylyltransferase [Syntrophobacteraceae bacterium]|nr:ThiF family adenylyltransferase [Syntrophobacteraceae bacterium]
MKGSSIDENRYQRQEILPEIGVEGQLKLAKSTVFIVGCGALGCLQANLLARAGLGRLRIADRDLVEWSNLQRQILFEESDAASNVSKAEAAARHLRAINSSISVESLAVDVTVQNAESLLSDADLVLDGTDNFETRYLINDVCVKLEKPWVYGGVIGTEGMAMPILPGRGPCLRCVLPHTPDPGTLPTCDTAGVLNAMVAVVASMQVAIAMRILLGTPPADVGLLRADVWDGSFNFLKIPKDEECPCCARRNFEFLDADRVSRTTSLCGRNSVQVNPPRVVELDFASLRKRLERAGQVTTSGLLLRFKADEGEMVIFPDGRAIVTGTTDQAKARTFYARYLGT